jgi:hypothetical protein
MGMSFSESVGYVPYGAGGVDPLACRADLARGLVNIPAGCVGSPTRQLRDWSSVQ